MPGLLTIQAEETYTRIAFPLNYTLEKALISAVEPDSYSGKALSSIAYCVSKTKKLAATSSLAIGTTLMDKDIAPGSNVLKEALGVIFQKP
jgi:hypothetical protein